MSHKLTHKELKALKEGYISSAELNSELAEEACCSDSEALQIYEKYICSADLKRGVSVTKK